MNKYQNVLVLGLVLLGLARVDAQQQSNQSISSMLSVGTKIRLDLSLKIRTIS